MNINNYILKIKNKKIKIGIIGLGYVGLNLLIQFCKKKIYVNGYDIDKRKIINLNNKKSPISYILDSTIKDISKYSSYNNNYNSLKKNDVIIICLPTPLTKNETPDLSHIYNFINFSEKYLKKFQTIILESTTYPGTTEEFILPILKKKFTLGKNFFLGYSPERENPSSDNKYIFSKTPKIISGLTPSCKKIVNEIYKIIIEKTISASTIKTAEATKIVENLYRSVNIGLVNELKMLFYEMGIDINEILDLAETKPFGFQRFNPGPGVGGHCIPIDPFYLSYKAKEYNFDTKFINIAGEINQKTTNWVFEKSKYHFFKKFQNKKKMKVLIIGVSYKKNIEDTRESSAIRIISKFIKEKIPVSYFDPYVKEFKVNIEGKKYIVNKIYSLKKLSNFNITIILSNHDNINYKTLLNKSKLIIDTRQTYKIKNKKIIQL
jgi:UDP-N-acetyl-D-glucosamine dehydrogenase